ncbi:aminodeoxychorismate synthase component I [Brucella pituitosa]|uniref:aminodeoxychorismate synthase component I n=1 Tax=Brucella pituitosa TaxID=571256 RepID=UPI0009A17B6E|nr:aminodeoxychorismate synthase component I [Brucella pituitosa]
MRRQIKSLLIDNHDSFTHNLAHLLAEVNGVEPVIIPNDKFEWDEISHWSFDNIVISPGPGHPGNLHDFHISAKAIARSEKPLLGICLGYQGLALAYGAKVTYGAKPVHGFASTIQHTGTDIFKGIDSRFSVGRYHSLVVSRPLPEELRELAATEDGELMAIAHREKPQWGVQFHPESILSEKGRELITNFRDITVRYNQHAYRSLTRDIPFKRGHNHSGAAHSNQSRIFHYWKEIPLEVSAEHAFVNLFGASENAFWLDSALHEKELGKWSYLGASAPFNSKRVSYDTNSNELSILDGANTKLEKRSIFSFLKNDMCKELVSDNRPPCPFVGGYVGWLGYEMRNECGFPTRAASVLPDAVLLKADHFIAIDHINRRTYVVAASEVEISSASKSWVDETCRVIRTFDKTECDSIVEPTNSGILPNLNVSKMDYLKSIKQALDWIKDGETYQLCLTNEMTVACPAAPLELYQVLRRVNPAPYAAFFKWSGGTILSTSPEGFLEVDGEGNVLTRPMKGTMRRSPDPILDRRTEHELRNSSKDLAENIMIVDLLRNDISRVCEPGSVVVDKMCEVHSFANLHTLVSTIRGKLRKGKSAIDLLRATFPGGSITGVPKERTLALIDKLEQRARGPYTGTLGWFGYDGRMDLNILIRTIVETAGSLAIGVGGGIVADSHAEAEYDEILLKAKAVLHSVELTAARKAADQVTANLGRVSQLRQTTQREKA